MPSMWMLRRAFAEQALSERRAAGLPPFAHLALLRALDLWRDNQGLLAHYQKRFRHQGCQFSGTFFDAFDVVVQIVHLATTEQLTQQRQMRERWQPRSPTLAQSLFGKGKIALLSELDQPGKQRRPRPSGTRLCVP